MKHLISLKEQSREDILEMLDIAARLKARRRAGEASDYLKNKSLIMLFQKSSTRTRLSFETAMTELGGHAVHLDQRSTQISLADYKDEVRAILRMGDAFMMRALKAADVLYAASLNVVPVIDGCSEKYHPCQALGDILTMAEAAGGLSKVKKVVWLGIENNVSNTLMLACAKLGINVWIVAPERDGASVDEEVNRQAEATGKVHRTLDLDLALREADFVHTDTWLNMEFFADGKAKPEFQKEFERRVSVFKPYQLSAKLLTDHKSNARIMHCMPCHIGYEITRDAVDHPHSLIFPQAENRKHIQKGILLWLLGAKS